MGVYDNPIIPGFNPDPSIVRVGPDYFLVTSTFEYFPGVPIYHSTDLIRWRLIGHALTRRSQLDIRTPEAGGGIWAPTIRWHGGAFYVTTACFDRYRPQADDRVWPRGFYVSTADIWDDASWSDPVYFDQVGFDQDLFWDTDGTAYLSTTYRKRARTPGAALKDFAVHAAAVDLATGAGAAPPVLLRESRAGSGVAEGAHLFRRGRFCYLLTAEGGTEGGHCERVCRSEAGPLGPWEEWVDDGRGRVLWERRETFLVPVTWEDDWPVFNGGRKVTLQGDAPGLFQVERETAWRDDFEAEELQLGWYRKNTPLKKDFSLMERPGFLRLHGGPYSLSTPACPTLFLRKQTRDPATWETKLSFRPDSPHTEAGTVVYWNQHNYSSIGIRVATDGGGGASKRIIRFRPAEGAVVEEELASWDSDVVLTIKSEGGFALGFREELDGKGSGATRWVGQVSRQVMTRDPDVGAAFTGMMLGVYAFGELEKCFAPADFAYAEFR
ncbi:hypothetical protein SLS56_003531 [Neofusicoccum ribis]|uniref:Beta-xylosidase C-terminal Concanavalin A-like domain-containing protein n=1 Tax=Neofusicoccum ribis TaxID=45134 RepID=A0ABR3SZZ7_9PEZI